MLRALTTRRLEARFPAGRHGRDANVLLGLTLLIGISLLLLGSCRQRCGDAGTSGPEPHRLALLIGISRYDEKIAPRTGPYLGPVSGAEDVMMLKDVLTSPPWSLKPDDVLYAIDEQATYEKIEGKFKELTELRAQSGDAVLIYLGGHGMEIQDDDGDELDGMDESFVPWDYISNDARTGARTNLRDDRLGQLLALLRNKVGSRGSVTVILDWCHSGTGTRTIGTVRGRGWVEQLDGPPPKRNLAGRAKGPSGMFTLGQPEREGFAVIAAAASEEEANPAYIQQFKAMHGALTGEIAAVMSKHGPGISFYSLFDQASASVAADLGLNRGQHPQLEGVPADRPFFSLSGPPAVRHLTVKSVLSDGQSIELPVGQAHGATVGSRYALYRGCSRDEHHKLAEAEIEALAPFTSRARIAQPYLPVRDTASLKAAWAFEQSHRFESQPLVLLLPAGTALPPALTHMEFITTTVSTEQLYDFQLRHDSGMWILERLDGSRAAEVADGPGAPDKLKQILRASWRWSYLARLQSPDTAPLAPPTVRIVPLDAARSAVPASSSGSPVSFTDGTMATVELQMNPLAESAGSFVWITLLQLAPDGTITAIFPAPDDVSGNRLLADGKPHRLRMPDYQFRLEIPGRYYLKAIATTVPVDFAPIISAAERTERDFAIARAPTELSALALLLSAGADGKLPQLRVPLLTWSTTQLAFDVVAVDKKH